MKVRVSIRKTASTAAKLGMDPTVIAHELRKQQHQTKRLRRKLGRRARQGA
jgi:hypothetical protein